MKLFTVTLVLVLGVVSPAVTAERQVVVLTSTDTDDRLNATREAITFWNQVFSELGLETRLGHPDVVVGSTSNAFSRTTPDAFPSVPCACRREARNLIRRRLSPTSMRTSSSSCHVRTSCRSPGRCPGSTRHDISWSSGRFDRPIETTRWFLDTSSPTSLDTRSGCCTTTVHTL